MTKIMYKQYIDSTTIEPLMASRLIPLDKGEGAVRPIGVGEVLRRILAKCVMNVVKEDVVHASGSLQLCAGQKSGSEAAVHVIGSQEYQRDYVLEAISEPWDASHLDPSGPQLPPVPLVEAVHQPQHQKEEDGCH